MSHYPMSADQRNDLDQAMGSITEMLDDIVGLLRACYDDQDSRTFRAEEVRAAMQRFRWALERGPDNASDLGTPIERVRAAAADGFR